MSVDSKCFSSFAWDASLFAISAHRTVFEAMAMVAQRTGQTDALAVISELASTGKLDDVSGRDAVRSLLRTVYLAPGPICIEAAADYRAQLVKAAGYRAALKVWSESEQDIRTMRADLAEIAETIGAAARDNSAPTETLLDQLNALIDDIDRKSPIECFSTGVESLDRAFRGGIHRGEMLVVGADTSGGKSILLHQAALTAALSGKNVVLFSLEMPAKDILRRMAANLIGKPLAEAHEIVNGERGGASMGEINRAFSQMMKLPLIIRDNLTEVGEIDAEIRGLASMKKCDLALVDYLQIVSMPKADTREQAISELARRLKLTALKMKCAVMSATQLNDDGKIRESRAIGMHADHVIIIKHSDGGTCFRVDKNRRGQRDVTMPCVMRGDISRFEESHEQR